MNQDDTRTPRPRNRGARIAIGAAGLALLAGALVWSVAGYLPASPRAAAFQETPSELTAVSFGVPVDAETTEQIPYGQTAVLDGLSRGDRYELEASPPLREDFEKKSEAEQRELRESEEWSYELPAFAATVESARLVSESSFAEWYPAWSKADATGQSYREEDVRFLLVDVRIENLGDQGICPEQPVLRSPLFHGDNSKLCAGMFVDNRAQDAVYPFYWGENEPGPDDYVDPDANLNMVGLDGDALMVDAGETKTITYPFIVYRNSFNDKEAIDGIELSDFAIAYLDYNPWSIVELELSAR